MMMEPSHNVSAPETPSEPWTVPAGAPVTPVTPAPGPAGSGVSGPHGAVPEHAASFVPDEVFARLGTLTDTEADAYDFGIIRLDDDGVIELFNAFQQRFAALPDPRVIGQNFFTAIAPCTQNRLFRGRFRRGVANGHLDIVFRYAFTFRVQPTVVTVHLFRHADSLTNWVFVLPDPDPETGLEA